MPPRPARAGLILLMVTALHTSPEHAQTANQPLAITARIGTGMVYLDEPAQIVWGVSYRHPWSRRWSIEPEFVLSDGDRFRQWTLMPTLTGTVGPLDSRITVYVLGGVGLFRELDKAIDYSRGEVAWAGGGGLRVHTGRFVISPEGRLGQLSRITIGVGVLLR